MELVHPLFKWLHIIAGITWIGLLYFFNWINVHFAATLDADTKKKVVPELMPRALSVSYTHLTLPTKRIV